VVTQIQRPSRPTLHRAESGADPGLDLMLLLDSFPGLADRLAAPVAATWARRLDDQSPEAEAARPALHTALYGRAVCAVRTWLGEPSLDVDEHMLDVQMLDQPGEERITRTNDGVSLHLPFSWLVDLWFRDLTSIWGRFCLAAAPAPNGQWELITVGTDLGAVKRIMVDAPATG
jgi:hypothetical protein